MASTSNTRALIVLVGPTAGGKTSLSVRLAQDLPGGGECISADSMQVYEGMDIGTATPTMEERGGVPHHLLSVVPPDTPFTLDDWLAAAETAIADVRGRGRWPIVVGGTNLYVQALLFGLLDAPPPDQQVRAELASMDPPRLREELQSRDPAAAARIHPNDIRRTIRAVEYARSTGRPLSDAQVQWGEACRPDARILGLDWPVEAINARINARVSAMMKGGLLREVSRLHEGGMLGEQAAAGVGYAQLIEHLEGRCSLDEAVEQIKIRSRRLGKQQRTWLRRFRVLPNLTWLRPVDEDPYPVAMKTLVPQWRPR
jgi:tRNA dimethylallyltransferase